MRWHSSAIPEGSRGPTSVSLIVPEARGDNRFFIFSISRGLGGGGGDEEGRIQ